MFMCFKGSPVSSAPPLVLWEARCGHPALCADHGLWGVCEVKPVNLSIVGDIMVVEGERCRRLDPTG